MPIPVVSIERPSATLPIMLVLLIASSMTVMAAAILAPSLPGIGAYFNDQPGYLIPLAITMPALSVALCGGFTGYLSDRFGRKPVLIGALVLYALAGSSGWLLDNIAGLLIGRAFLGLAVAAILSVTTTLIGDYFPPAERARFLGLQAAATAGGALIYLNLGGLLAEWHWRGPFLVYLCSLLLVPFALRALPEPQRDASINAPDALPGTIRMPVICVYLIAAGGMALLYVVPTQLPFLLAEKVGASSGAVGFAISTTTVTATLMSLTYGRIARGLTPTRIYATAFLLIALGYALTGLSEHYWPITLGIAISGLGLGLFTPNGAVWLMHIVPAQSRARVIGGYTAALFLGQFISPLVMAPVASQAASLGSVFLFAAGVAAIVATLLTASTER